MRNIINIVETEQAKENPGHEITLRTGDNVDIVPRLNGAIHYSCPVCANIFTNPGNAIACRDRYFNTGGWSVGDLVIIPGAHHWAYQEDDPWVAFVIPANPDSRDYNDFSPHPVPYFVVTALHVDPDDRHRCLVTVCTLAGGSLRAGWNPVTGAGHKAMYRPGYFDPDASTYWGERVEKLTKASAPSPTLESEAAELANIKISTKKPL
jgi:hypothetical protein